MPNFYFACSLVAIYNGSLEVHKQVKCVTGLIVKYAYKLQTRNAIFKNYKYGDGMKRFKFIPNNFNVVEISTNR
jgi:hypothetical protein